MTNRDDLLFYARYLSDDRAHKILGKCLMEGSRQNVTPQPETVTPTDRTTLAALLTELPVEAVTSLLWLAQRMKDSTPDHLAGITLLLDLRPDYAHMVSVFAQSLYDAQAAIQPLQEVSVG